VKRRVVVTGLGALASSGEGAPSLWEAVVEQRTAIGMLSHFGENWQVPGAWIQNFEPDKYIAQRKSIKVMARDIQLAMGAAKLAMDDSKVEGYVESRQRFGVVIGSGVLDHELDELLPCLQNALDDKKNINLKKFGSEGISALFPLWLLKYLPNMPACHISVNFNLQGINNTLTTGVSAGLSAVGESFRIIQRNSADAMLAGASESKTNPVGIAQYGILGGLLDFNKANIKTAYKFFDTESDGFIVGEGAGFVVLEEYERAQKRNAKIYGEIVGFGSSSMNGQKIAMEKALSDAGISKKEITYIQAAGLGLAQDDLKEISAIQEVFGPEAKNIFVTGSKPVIGFTGFASGILDFIISSVALTKHMIPPAMNLNKPAVKWDFTVPTHAPVSKEIKHVMINAFGFNGQCASVVIKPI
jgi:3-oxoacyl-[acyl-carrier-protein] synthase II